MIYHELKISGQPIAQKRHRDISKNGIQWRYDPSAKDKQNFLKKALSKQNVAFGSCPTKPYTTALKVSCIFTFEHLKSHFRTGKYKYFLKENPPFFKVTKPDIDNLQKFVYDSLNGVFWKDDSVIVESYSYKCYQYVASTKVFIEEANICNTLDNLPKPF